MSAPVLQVRLAAGYGKATVLEDVTFTLGAGECLGLLGSSGAGKSTLLFTLLGLLHHRGGWAKGEVLLNGQDLLTLPKREMRTVRGKQIGLVPQSPTAALNPALSLQAHFQTAWTAHRRKDEGALSRRVEQMFRRVGLPTDATFLRRKPGQVSIGQAQRCALALALLHGPALVIADEPTSALDPVNQTEVLDLLREISTEDGVAVLFVSHDLLSVFRLCSSVAILSKGRLTAPAPLHAAVHNPCPELHALVRTLPVPVEVLLAHTLRGAAQISATPSEEPALAYS